MPEGHTVHRAARRQHSLLAGRPVAASSPQGRFADGAAALDGRVLERVEAAGKHLFYAFDRGEVLHVHLGLFGRFRYHEVPPPEPRGLVRLRLIGAAGAVDLSGPTACDLIGEEGREAILARLGPDPLRADADPERAIASLARRRLPIGAALLDQSIIAGLGNVYRAEVLFTCGIDPAREARSLDRAQLAAVWDESRRMLREGAAPRPDRDRLGGRARHAAEPRPRRASAPTSTGAAPATAAAARRAPGDRRAPLLPVPGVPDVIAAAPAADGRRRARERRAPSRRSR